ncbi:MAG TPA: HIT family protein [Acidimicrobiia bacterium]|nr:HIT family protein [Acidimicrobiia bacterium]
MVDGCLFCSIIAGKTPADVVLDTPVVVAFLDHRPLFPGHTLVVPRAHVETLRDLDDPTRDELFAQVQRVAAAVQDATGSAGSFVAMNNVVSQSVPHAHVHAVPRNPKDGLRGFFWPRTRYADAAEAAAMAESIRVALGESM